MASPGSSWKADREPQVYAVSLHVKCRPGEVPGTLSGTLSAGGGGSVSRYIGVCAIQAERSPDSKPSLKDSGATAT
jgi:hypothetical protein